MGNKVKYNLKNVYAAKLTETVKDGVTTFTYDPPKPIPGAVSISLDAEGETKAFYADGIVYFRSVTNNGYSGDLEIALIPEWFRTEILQEVLDDKGVLVEKSGLSDTVKSRLFLSLMEISVLSVTCFTTARHQDRPWNPKPRKIPLNLAQRSFPSPQIRVPMAS